MLTTVNKLDSCVDVAIVCHDIYEYEYGIYNHFKSNRPLSSVAFHPAENINNGSKLEEIIKIYMDRDIRHTFGLSLTEYMNLPHDIVIMLNTLALEPLKKRDEAANEFEKAINTK